MNHSLGEDVEVDGVCYVEFGPGCIAIEQIYDVVLFSQA